MPEEKSLKRNSQELGSADNEEASNEPEAKVVKIDDEASEPNLKTDTEISLNDSDVLVVEESETPVEEKTTIESQATSITIKFHDKTIMDLYKTKFVEFLSSFVEFKIKIENDCLEVCRDECVEVEECVVVESTETPSKKRKKRSRVKKELFVVDATPSSQAPPDLRYTTKFTISTEKVEVEKSSRQTCFNCDQYHSLKDCPQPKDFNRINAARQKFRQQPKSSRYHLEEEQKFSHLKPGKLSDELRKALGLYKNETPHFIYMMRQLGYPPGWLEEAKLVHSNLDMFDIDGNFVKTAKAKKHGLDNEKIVDYPGFNVPFEQGFKDEYRKFRVPPFSDNFSKEAMLKFYDEKFAKEEDNLETCDMEIDTDSLNTSQELKVADSLNTSQELKVVDEANETEPESRDSPSLVDLEEQKQHLLEELDDRITQEPSKDFLAVKTSCFGTPILKSTSPYMTLPHPDKFSKDVSPVINFENLPNSTGKYEQMTDVLQKVRNTLKKLNT